MICKYCQSENIRKYGTYKETQYYYCNDCKRIEIEGAGTLLELFDDNPSQSMFLKLLGDRKILMSKALEIIGKKSIAEIEDYKAAMDKIIEYFKTGGK